MKEFPYSPYDPWRETNHNWSPIYDFVSNTYGITLPSYKGDAHATKRNQLLQSNISNLAYPNLFWPLANIFDRQETSPYIANK